MSRFIKLVFLSLFLLSFSSPSQAQQHAMNAMRVHMEAVRTHQHMHRQFMFMHQMNAMNQNTKKYSEKYKFSVINQEGDTIHARKKVKVSFFAPLNELKIRTASGDTIFMPEKTKGIFTKRGKQVINGIPCVDSWKFNILSVGETDFYASYPENDIKFITHYKLPNDTLKPLTSENMALLMKGNEKAEKALKKNKQEKAMKIFIKDERKKEKETAEKTKPIL